MYRCIFRIVEQSVFMMGARVWRTDVTAWKYHEAACPQNSMLGILL